MAAIRIALLSLVFASVISLIGCKPKEKTRQEPNNEVALSPQKDLRQEPSNKVALPSQEHLRQDSSPSGAVALAGTLYFAGRPIHELTSVEPIFSLNNRGTGERGIRPKAEYDKSRFEIRELRAGDYVMFVSIDANPDNPGGFPGYPGDFFLPAKAAQVSVPDSGATFNADLAQVIHLTLPQDNAVVMERWGARGQDMIAFKAPVEFAWEAVIDGAQYHYAVHRMQSEPFKAVERDVAKSTTEATRVPLSLPPNSENEFYLFELRATKGGRRVGELVSHGERGYGTDFRFRVE